VNSFTGNNINFEVEKIEQSHAIQGGIPLLSQILFQHHPRCFQSFAVTASNIQSVEAALLFANGIHRFAAIIGPSGWGKTHLLESVSDRMNTVHKAPKVHNATDWALGHVKQDSNDPLILDNLHEAMVLNRIRQTLRIALERRFNANRPTLLSFTSCLSARQVRIFLPNSRMWKVATMDEPQPNERILVVDQIAHSEELILGQTLVKLLAYRVKGNGRTLLGVIKRLRLDGRDWSDPKAALRACGALVPFLADNSGWDPQEAIIKAVDDEALNMHPKVKSDWAIYTMLKEAGLSENQVASYFEIEPSEAYLRSNAVSRSISQSPRAQQIMGNVQRRAVELLLQE